MAAMPAAAQIKTDANATLCTSYSGISIAPNGGIVVNGCVAGTTTPPVTPPVTSSGGTFAFDGTSVTSLAASAWGAVKISRTGGSTGAATVNLAVSGGCVLGQNSVLWGDGDASTIQFGVGAPANNASCSVTITSVSPSTATLGSPSTLAITVGSGAAGGGGGGGQVAGCSPTPSDAVALPAGLGGIEYSGADIINLKSGQVAYQPLPNLANYGLRSGKVQFNDVSYAPVGGAIQEISVGPCPGVIDTTGGALGTCYKSNNTQQNTGFMSFFWIQQPLWGSTTDATAQMYHVCEAYNGSQTLYVNIRYTYSGTCPIVGGSCGYVLTWGGGPF